MIKFGWFFFLLFFSIRQILHNRCLFRRGALTNDVIKQQQQANIQQQQEKGIKTTTFEDKLAKPTE